MGQQANDIHKQNCNVCDGFKKWTATQRNKKLPKDCPPDLTRLGRHSWTLLHTIGATYPVESPSESERQAALHLLNSLSILFPCRLCADDFKHYIHNHPPQIHNRSAFELWLCKAHNHVNLRTGKPPFDCSLLAQRWRDGWDDGRCNP